MAWMKTSDSASSRRCPSMSVSQCGSRCLQRAVPQRRRGPRWASFGCLKQRTEVAGRHTKQTSPVEICDVLAPKSVPCVSPRFAQVGKRIMGYSQRACFDAAKYMARPNNVLWFARGWRCLDGPWSRLPICERQVNTACPSLPYQGCWFFLPQRCPLH